jgi:hypothetical protein
MIRPFVSVLGVVLLGYPLVCTIAVETSDITQWSRTLKSEIVDKMYSKVHADELQNAYDEVPRRTVVTDGNVLCAGTAAKIGIILEKKELALKKIVSRVQDLYRDKKQSRQRMRLNSSDMLANRSQIIGIASTAELEQDIYVTKGLSEDMRKITDLDPNILQGYHVSNTGLIRSTSKMWHGFLNPASHHMAGPDPRLTDWYSGAITGAKDVFVVIDRQMIRRVGVYKKALVKIAFRNILETTGHLDTFGAYILEYNGDLTELIPHSCLHKSHIPFASTDMKGVMMDSIHSVLLHAGKDTSNSIVNATNKWVRGFREIFQRVKTVRPKGPEESRPGVLFVFHADDRPAKDRNIAVELSKMNLPSLLPIMSVEFAAERPKAITSRSDIGCSFWGLGIQVNDLNGTVQAALYSDLIVDSNEFSRQSPYSRQSIVRLNSGFSRRDSSLSLLAPIFDDHGETLIGVAGIDFRLIELKDILDTISDTMGKSSFPALVTVHGETLYHYLQSVYKTRELVGTGTDIGVYEYFETETANFKEDVRPHLLNGSIGFVNQRVSRAMESGNSKTEGLTMEEIDYTYFFAPVPNYPLRLLLVYDTLDVEKAVYEPNKLDITTLLSNVEVYLNTTFFENDTHKINKDLQFYNFNNCAHNKTPSVKFSNCKPDAYCDRVLKNLSHPPGVYPGAPPCVADSTCICHPKRWAVGLYSTDFVATHVGPKTMVMKDYMFDMQNWNQYLTKQFMNYIDGAKRSSNVAPYLTTEALASLRTGRSVFLKWVDDFRNKPNNDTVWIYFGSRTGSGNIFPGTNWGKNWDPTRRPWYIRSVSNPSVLAISSPYIDSGGAGLMNTLAKVVAGPSLNGRQRIEGVASYDLLYTTSHALLPTLTSCDDVPVSHPVRHVHCFLLDTNGFLLVHSDFLEQDLNADLETAEPIQNVFLGSKEPDIADVLIEAGIITQLMNKRSPTGEYTYNFYRLNSSVFESEPVQQGKLEGSKLKCLETNATWYMSYINSTNAFLLVIDGYKRKNISCSFKTETALRVPVQKTACEKIKDENHFFHIRQNANRRIFNACRLCNAGKFRRLVLEDCTACPAGKQSSLTGSYKCTACEEGKFAALAGSPTCSSCSRGQFSFEQGSSTSEVCKTCPEGGYCEGGNQLSAAVFITKNKIEPAGMFVRRSYWRTSNLSTVFYLCPESSACDGIVTCPIVPLDQAWSDAERKRIVSNKCAYPSSVKSTQSYCVDVRCRNFVSEGSQWSCRQNADMFNQLCVIHIPAVEGCREGYTGNVCNDCKEGYGKDGTKCVKCPHPALGIFAGVCGFAFTLAMYAYMISQTMKKHGDMDSSAILLRIVVSNTLALSVIKDLAIEWALELKWLFVASDATSEPPINVECLFKSATSIPMVYLTPAIYLTLPLILTFVNVVYWVYAKKKHERMMKLKSKQRADSRHDSGRAITVFEQVLTIKVAERFKRLSGRDEDAPDTDQAGTEGKKRQRPTIITKQHSLVSRDAALTFNSKLLGCWIILQYMLLPKVMNHTFSYLNCGPLGQTAVVLSDEQRGLYNENATHYRLHNPDPRSFFRTTKSIQCFDERHIFWLVLFFFPALIAYCIAVPLGWFYLLHKNRKTLYTLPRSQCIYGFLTQGYEPQYWYWELVCYTRKVLMVLFGFFGAREAVFLSAFVLLVALVLQIEYKPFKDDRLDEIEKLSLISNLLTIFMGLFFHENITFAVKISIVVCITLTNLHFFCRAGILFVEFKLIEKAEQLHAARDLASNMKQNFQKKWREMKQLFGRSRQIAPEISMPPGNMKPERGNTEDNVGTSKILDQSERTEVFVSSLVESVLADACQHVHNQPKHM